MACCAVYITLVFLCCMYHAVAHNVDCVTSDDRVVCAELAVPRVNTTAPLYHQLQQYTQTSNRGRSAEYKLEDGRLEDQQERECGENSLPQEGTYTTTSNSSPATTRAAESESSKVVMYFTLFSYLISV